MHLLAAQPGTIADGAVAVELGQTPGDIVVLSAADSEIACLAAAQRRRIETDPHAPRLRLASLLRLGHNYSVDRYVETVLSRARFIAVRLLGGSGYWRYGVERLAALARERGIVLAVLPGEDRDDPRLAEASTLPAHELDRLLRFFRESGRANLGALLRRLAMHAGASFADSAAHVEPQPVPRLAGYLPGAGAVALDKLVAELPHGRPVVAIIFYRALLLADDTAAIDALYAALTARGLAPARRRGAARAVRRGGPRAPGSGGRGTRRRTRAADRHSRRGRSRAGAQPDRRRAP